MKREKRPEDLPNKQLRLPPFFAGVLPYRRGALARDIVAGVALAAAAIPIDMGYTKIAGMPVASGLYILLLPAVAFAIFGASRHLVVGADSATAAILAAGILPLAAMGSSEYLGYVALLTLMVGALLLVCRVFRLGFVANFLSRTVLTGFLTGIGVQVAISQLGDLFGITGLEGTSLQKLAGFVAGLPQTNPTALLLSAVAFLLVFVPKWFYRKLPFLRPVPFGLIAIVGGIVAGHLAPAGTFEVVGSVQGGLPSLSLPVFSLDAFNALLGPCVAITVVIITQSTATAEVYADRHGEAMHPNRDILALGMANIAAAFTGAFVPNGSPTKTEIAAEAGASSQIANLAAAGVVLLVLLFFTGPLQYIPSAVLAAIVLAASLGLVDIKTMKKVFRFSRGEFAVAAATALVVVLVGAAQGILFAMVLSLLEHVKKSYHPHSRLLATGPDGTHWQDVPRGGQAQPGIVVYHFSAALYYANAGQFAAEARFLALRQQGVQELALDFSAVSSIDYSGCEMLQELVAELQAKGVRVAVVFIAKDVLTALKKTGLAANIGREKIYPTLKEYLARHGTLAPLLPQEEAVPPSSSL